MSVEITTLPNGFRVVSEHMPGLMSASVGVWVFAGARNEEAQENGIAHFLEHMAFKGTTTRSAVEIAERIEDVGGYLNAYTSREATAYYARVLKDDVPLAVDVLADILRNPVFDTKEIEVERGVILQEIGQALDTPDDIIFDWLQEKAYPDHPLGRPILGLEQGVRRFGRDDLVRFVDHHYRPGQMVLAAAGGVEHDALVRAAEQLFADMQPAARRVAQVAQFRGGDIRRQRDLEQAHMALAFEAPNYKDERIYTAQILSSVLGGGMSSRLFQEIREKRGLCYTIFAHTGAYADTGMTTIYAGTSAEQLGALTELTIDELKRAADEINAAELDRARTQMKAAMLMGLESPSNRAERLARMVQIWDRVPGLEEMVAHIDAVNLTDLRNMAGHMVSSAPTALALYGPLDSAPSWEALQDRRVA